MNNTLRQQKLITAKKHIEQHRYREATPILIEILVHHPHDADTAFLTATAFRLAGMYVEAARYYRKAARNRPDFFAALCNLGAAEQATGNTREAIAALEQALRIKPDSVEALCNCGMAYAAAARHDEALRCFKEAVALHPAELFQRLHYAQIACTMGAYEDARAMLTDGLLFTKDTSELHLALGRCAEKEHHFSRAKDHYITTLQQDPHCTAAHFGLGTIMREWNQLDEAVTCYRNALRFAPNDIYSLVNLGEVLQKSGNIDESEVCFQQAISLDPHCTIAYDNFLVSMNYSSTSTQEQIIAAHTQWGTLSGNTAPPRTTAARNSHSGKKIRIGYTSPDFCNHPAGAFLLPMLTHSNRDSFEIYCYAHTLHSDARTEQFKSVATQWQQVERMSDEALASLIKHDNIDILVDTAGHFTGNRLSMLATRPSPLQISGIGYPGPTGCSGIDYRISDVIIDPLSTDNNLPDTPLRIASGFCCFTPQDALPPVTPLPAHRNGYITFGSLHTTARLNSETIALWSSVLHTVSDSRILICRDTLTPNTIKRLSSLFYTCNIDPARITFRSSIPQDGYLHLYDEIDISLDTTPWSGHTTACESIIMGVPIITLTGQRHAGRMVTSILHASGNDNCIATDGNSFVTTAQTISSNPAALRYTRATLRDQVLASPLCDGAAYMRLVEKSFLSLVPV